MPSVAARSHATSSRTVSGDKTAERMEEEVGSVKIPAFQFYPEPLPVETSGNQWKQMLVSSANFGSFINGFQSLE